ncbi:MAG: 50S ribosomal protein L3 [Patescibacteria group bacterium]
MAFILGKKVKMTQYFDEDGKVHPGTLLLAEPNKVDLIRNEEKDGYSAVRLELGKTKREFRNAEIGELKIGDVIDVSVFNDGDKIRVTSTSKGKGFQGVVKRHGFHGGPRTHGQKHSEREPGSIGSTGPQRVFKGQRMPGRMGGNKVTVDNLKVLKTDKETNEILISGAVPGRKGTLVEIRTKK